VSFPIEVVAEVVYVLGGVYQVPREEISKRIKDLIDDINPDTENLESLLLALDYYSESKLDFIDCLLAAYSLKRNATILTFDKKLQNFIVKQAAPNQHIHLASPE